MHNLGEEKEITKEKEIMSTILKKTTALGLILVLLVTVFPAIPVSAAEDVSSVGALWESFTPGTGTFTVTESSRLFVASITEPTGDLLQTAQLLQRQLRAQFKGCFEKLVWGKESMAKTGDIVLVLDESANIGADGYALDVTAATATVTAADTDGLIYGTNNLIKCFRAVGGKSISCFSGDDTPDTRERTVMLDTGRKYYTVEWVCNFIRQMSWMGYNALEIHFSEDGGFRADLWDPTYYKGDFQPENDFSWLCGSHVQSWVKDPYRDDPDAGKYLSTEELVQICEVAKEYHIEIIPSFDSPAHMDYITWKFEQNYKSNTSYSFKYDGTTYKASSTKGCINYTGKTGASSPTWPYYTTIDITDGTMAKAFVFALYEDMADFFKEYAGSTKFNIGADEVNLSSSYGPKWSYSQFPGYVNDLNRMLNDKGYTVRMYNDFIGSTTYNMSSNNKAVYTFDSNIEICYWNSDFNPTDGTWSEPIWHVKFFWENNTGTTDNWGDGGRTMYNCIQTNTYYVLREGTSGTHRDARDPSNRNWTFYQTNEQQIYENWYPADISEKGVYSEDAADVPANQLGGAYFLIWNDYAAMNTEEEVWNGALDCYDKDRYYYLFDIMASNIIKMWHPDINEDIAYSKFAAVRDATLKWFPGFTSCSKAASLPAATDPVKATTVDKSALQAAVDAAPATQGNYTNSTWANYQTALTAARAVLDDDEATQDEVTAALATLNTATSSLVAVDKSALRAAVNGAITEQGNYTDSTWNAYQTALSAAQGVLNNGDASQDEVDTALKNLNTAKSALVSVDKSTLQTAVNNAPTSQGIYTDESWNAYQTALSTAQEVLADGNATQQAVDTALSELNNAIDALEKKPIEGGHILSIHKASNVTPVGKKIGLIITASADAVDLTISLGNNTITPAVCLRNIQTLRVDGVETEVSVWMVNFTATEKGSYTYTVTVNGTTSQDVEVTVE